MKKILSFTAVLCRTMVFRAAVSVFLSAAICLTTGILCGVYVSAAETSSDSLNDENSPRTYIPDDPWKNPDPGSKKEKGPSWEPGDLSGTNWWVQAVRLPEAWYYRDQFTEIKIGVVDKGFDETHEDLSIQILNPDENSTSGDRSHGTGTAAVIGALQNNEKGISGVVEKADLYGYSADLNTDVFKGINACLEEGCKIINLSMSNTARMDDDFVNDIIKWLIKLRLTYGDGFLIVESAGNAQGDAQELVKHGIAADYSSEYSYFGPLTAEKIEEQLERWVNDEAFIKQYPEAAGLSAEDIQDCFLIVGSVARTRKSSDYHMAYHSDFGAEVSVCAPGTHILTAVSGNRYLFEDGTSFAAPIVSGIAGLVWSVNPEMTNREVKEILVFTASSNVVSSNWWSWVKQKVVPVFDRDRYLEDLNYYMVDAKSAVELSLKKNGADDETSSAPAEPAASGTSAASAVPDISGCYECRDPQSGGITGLFLQQKEDGTVRVKIFPNDMGHYSCVTADAVSENGRWTVRQTQGNSRNPFDFPLSFTDGKVVIPPGTCVMVYLSTGEIKNGQMQFESVPVYIEGIYEKKYEAAPVTEKLLEDTAARLNVPQDMERSCEIGEPYYYNARNSWECAITVTTGEGSASASIDVGTGSFRNALPYNIP